MSDPVLEMLQSITTRPLVHEAALRGILAAQPNTSAIHQLAESLLAQVHATTATLGTMQPGEAARAQELLETLFKPPLVLPPEK